MGGGLLTNRTVLLAKIESSYGSDPTPAVSANEVEVMDLTIKPVFQKITRKPLRASLSPLAIKKSQKLWQLEFTTELKGSGTQGTAGRLSCLFKACGMVETVQAGSSVIYTPGNPASSCAFYVYKDGLVFKILGAVGNFDINIKAGKIPTVKWTFRGKYQIPTDASLVSPTYESTTGIPAENINAQLSGYAGVVRSLSVTLGTDIIDRPSLNAAGAIEGCKVAGRTPTGKLLMEAELRATEDTISDFDADTVVSLSTGNIGSVAGNRISLTATSKVQVDELNPTDEEGIFMFDLSLAFSGTDDELSLIMT